MSRRARKTRPAEVPAGGLEIPGAVRDWLNGLGVERLAKLEAYAARRRRLLAAADAHPHRSLRALMEETWRRDAALLAELDAIDAGELEDVEQELGKGATQRLDVETLRRRRALERMERMTPDELVALAMRAGILDENHELTEHYRNDEPSGCRPTD